MANNRLFRISQLLLVIPCMLREWINCFTDIGQFKRVTALSLKIISYPAKELSATIFDRAMHSPLLAKIIVLVWISMHFIAAILLTYGLALLIININKSSEIYQLKKNSLIFGLSFTICSYFTLLGFFAMDFFLSWMQGINFNADLMGYGFPLVAALIFLNFQESPGQIANKRV